MPSVVVSHFSRLTSPDVVSTYSGTWEMFVGALRDPAPSTVEKAALPLWSPAVFRDGYRSASNVEAVYALGFDVDKEPAPHEEDLRRALDGILSVAHTSSSSTVDAPRWRLMVALSRPVTAGEYRILWGAFAGVLPFPVGQEAKDPSRGWFFPRRGPDESYSLVEIEGKPIDVDDLLAEIREAEGASTAKESPSSSPVRAPSPSPSPNPRPGPGTGARDAAVAALGAAWPPTGSRHQAQRALAGALCRDGWSSEEAVEFLCGVCRAAGDEDRAKREATVRDTYDRASRGEPIEGWTRLSSLVSPGIVAGVRGMLDPFASGRARLEAELRRPSAIDVVSPVARGQERPLPPFPVAALPPPLRAFVEAEAEATQTPLDMSAMLVLGCVSASIAGKVEIELEKGYREPLNLFVVTAALPGERKSGTFADVFAPLKSAEQDAIALAAPAIAKAKTNRTILEQKIKGVRSEFAGLKRSEQDTNYRDNKVGASAEGGLKLRARLEELEEELRKAEVPNEPQYLADDVTMERLAGLMAEQGGRICIASPEGTVFGIVSGRYSRNGQSSFEVLLKGHAGDALRIDRQSKDRPSVHLPKPCLTLALAVQPSVIQGLAANKEMRDLGLLARFLYSLPPSRVGTREIAPGPVPDHVRAAYHGVVGGLARIPVPGTAAMLFLSDGARDLHRAFRKELEPRLHPKTGDLAEVADWANKLPGAIGRVAGVLHCAGNAKGEIPNEVSADTMAAALEIGRYCLDHALVAFGRMAEGEIEGDARAVLEWVRRSGRGVVTMRHLQQHMRPQEVARSRVRRERAVQELVDRGDLTSDGAGWRLAAGGDS